MHTSEKDFLLLLVLFCFLAPLTQESNVAHAYNRRQHGTMQTAWRAQQAEVVMRLTWCSSSVSPQVLWPYWSRSLTWLSLWWAPWAAALWPSSSLPCFRSSPSIMKTWSGGRWSRTVGISLIGFVGFVAGTYISIQEIVTRNSSRHNGTHLQQLWTLTQRQIKCRPAESFTHYMLLWFLLFHFFLNGRRWLMDFLCVFVFSFCSTKVSSYQVALASKNSFLLNPLGHTAFYPNFKVNINRIIYILLIWMSCLQCFSATT